MADPIKIVLVDDHELFLKGITRLLEKQSDINVVGTYDNGATLLQDLPNKDVDLLLLDLQPPETEPEELLKDHPIEKQK